MNFASVCAQCDEDVTEHGLELAEIFQVGAFECSCKHCHSEADVHSDTFQDVHARLQQVQSCLDKRGLDLIEASSRSSDTMSC